MLKGNAVLIVDLGNSSTKCSCRFSFDKKNAVERKFELSNAFAPVQDDYLVSQEYSASTSTIFRADTKLGDQVIRGIFCNGVLQKNEFPHSVVRPSATSKKFAQPSSVLSLRLAFIRAYVEIINTYKVLDYRDLDIKWKVVCLLPPGDIEIGTSKMIDLVKDITSIESIMPEMEIAINISEVKILSEGLCAYIGVVNESTSVFRSTHEFLIEETVMVFDVGGGTTDCLVINNYSMVQNSRHTVAQGGNNVLQNVIYDLRMRDIEIDTAQVQQGILTGVVKVGAELVNIVPLVNRAKETVAQAIINDFQSYLERTGLKLQSVGYILATGGGCIDDQVITDTEDGDVVIRSLGSYLIENFKRYSTRTKLIELPTIEARKVNDDGEFVRVREVVNPRDLNLIGAGIAAAQLLVPEN